MKKYRIVYADPPWPYFRSNFNRGAKTSDPGQIILEDHYKTMTKEELLNFPMSSFGLKDSVFFIWATSAKLDLAFECIKSWKLTYKSSLVWNKMKHNVSYYSSLRHEILLICGKGSSKPDLLCGLPHSVFEIPRTRHSEKPEEFRNYIDKHWITGDRIELFARKKINGWDSWGNEI